MVLNYLSTVSSVKSNEVMMNIAYVEGIKKSLHKESTEVDLSIMNKDNMLGLKVKVSNANQLPLVFESGIDAAFLDAVLQATSGDTEALQAYDPTAHHVDTGMNFKNEVLHMFLGSPLPVQANIRKAGNGSSILEVTFQLGYCRKLRIYFKGDDNAALHELQQANVLKLEDTAA